MVNTEIMTSQNGSYVLDISGSDIVKKHKIVGTVEKVKINGKRVLARIDTGAGRSSICRTLAKKLRLGPPIKGVVVRSVHGRSIRPVVQGRVVLKGKKIKANFTVTDRRKMNFDVLVGRNILKRGFLVNPAQ